MTKQTAIPDSLFTFLKDLSQNNHRDWFQKNKDRHDTARTEFKAFAETLFNEMSKIDEVEEFKVFRIYRDVRFSKNKTPYKTCFSGYIKRSTKWRRGGYYFHIEPDNTFAGGGFWEPNAPDLRRIRQEIAADDKPLRKIINSASFKKNFGTLDGNQLKTAPRGYAKDHPAVDLLRYKQFLVNKPFTEAQALDKSFAKEMVKAFKAMLPLFDYMSEVLTTDANGVPIE
ncbi:MAG: DUF2461 domain-containing protein [Bacteroidota bacterium]